MGDNSWFRYHARWFWLLIFLGSLISAFVSFWAGDYFTARSSVIITVIAAGVLTVIL